MSLVTLSLQKPENFKKELWVVKILRKSWISPWWNLL